MKEESRNQGITFDFVDDSRFTRVSSSDGVHQSRELFRFSPINRSYSHVGYRKQRKIGINRLTGIFKATKYARKIV